MLSRAVDCGSIQLQPLQESEINCTMVLVDTSVTRMISPVLPEFDGDVATGPVRRAQWSMSTNPTLAQVKRSSAHGCASVSVSLNTFLVLPSDKIGQGS